jgi:ABC-2 type transport system ATP-binding protein
MLRIEDVHFHYGEIKALQGITFEVGNGETLGLLGPNGAGKTTTISLLTGVLKPTQGKVFVAGELDPTRASVRKLLGVAPQTLSLYEDLTGFENLMFFGKLYGLSSRTLKARASWALEFSGLESRAKDRVKTYSGGMKRRLNLVCALIHDPPVLLLDEPTVGVDPQSRNHIFEKIEALQKEGRTILYTTHYMEEAQRLCKRTAILDHGEILALDTVDNLIRCHGGRAIVEVECLSGREKLQGFPGTWSGSVFRMEADDPVDALQFLSQHGIDYSQLKIQRADLEAVFLNLTGRRLRDA